MPGRLGAHYIAEDNTKQTPVMIHRAILGSLERFIGILIENYAGDLPIWLDSKFSLARRLGVRATPGIAFIDSSGKLTGVKLGYHASDKPELQTTLNTLK